ncbi:hypothetical protein [Actinacidiphila bryophytorum]|uniref:hypothetical protein n=1 Tax=Actinacidiphila bryophytorum TaxID=1436133 RepID=UPI001960A107|nr:hypothetical protein [Actinacidiphila bryophytorum]MBM9435754.1 hypothetical protein [Actinacidiphila bryophytorum]MBN6541598.1 hypothetical protein [Actinacidiphila bryophytorum]
MKKQRPMSRAELLKRIEELRRLDAKKPQAAKNPRPRPRSEPRVVSAHTAASLEPQPYAGVEMKYRNGQWVQMHPESE